MTTIHITNHTLIQASAVQNTTKTKLKRYTITIISILRLALTAVGTVTDMTDQMQFVFDFKIFCLKL